ncbi:MAG: site-specific integrase [Solirubrobacteraceae bacterium]
MEDYRAWLAAREYTPGTARNMLKELGVLGRWMTDQEVEPGRLDAAAIEAFLAARHAAGQRRVPSMRAMYPLVSFLREAGVMAPDDGPERLTALERFIDVYRCWLVSERGLADATVIRYERLARRFMAERVSDAGELDVAGLTGADVSAFLLGECARVSVGSAKGRVAELRSLLRFLYLRGFTDIALADSVPSVAGWRDTEIPATMVPGDVQRLLGSCDRAKLGGARNYAIMLLLARLGLRSIEVARLQLEDLDWRGGELVVRGKARRYDRLPLPADVGEALTDYLLLRGKRDSRHVFLTVKAPTRPIRADLVGDVVQRGCLRAGIGHVGAHRLRHTFASELLRHGASIVDISQLLRHSDLATTASYAKVDLDRLRQVARPWPGAPR